VTVPPGISDRLENHVSHRMAAAASPHLLLDRVGGGLYDAFAEVDASVPETVIADLKAALAKNKARAVHEMIAAGR
jgi:hypothetical protein